MLLKSYSFLQDNDIITVRTHASFREPKFFLKQIFHSLFSCTQGELAVADILQTFMPLRFYYKN